MILIFLFVLFFRYGKEEKKNSLCEIKYSRARKDVKTENQNKINKKEEKKNIFLFGGKIILFSFRKNFFFFNFSVCVFLILLCDCVESVVVRTFNNKTLVARQSKLKFNLWEKDNWNMLAVFTGVCDSYLCIFMLTRYQNTNEKGKKVVFF